MASILNGTLQTPAEGSTGRQVVHPQTSTDQVVVNDSLFSAVSGGSEHGTISKNVKNQALNTGSMTDVIPALSNSGAAISNTVLSNSQPGHACIWLKYSGNTTAQAQVNIV